MLIANSIYDAGALFGQIFGVALAGMLLIILPPFICLFFTAFFLLAGTMFLWKTSVHSANRHHQKTGSSFAKDFKATLTYLAQAPRVLVLCTINMALVIQYMIAPLLLAPFVKNILHKNASYFGLIEMALAVGMLISSTLIPRFSAGKRWFKTSLMCISVNITSFIVFSMNHLVTIAIVLYFIIGLCVPIWTVVMSKAQARTEQRFQGRVQSLCNFISGIFIVIAEWDITIHPHVRVKKISVSILRYIGVDIYHVIHRQEPPEYSFRDYPCP